ncbi:hypothetical protein AYK26_04110 [Euryarchaeota archaeon SM23-78]|nr:MAG: hypothetical protein AYK26_04110 [Euryarchaeota archaeon SM23-78]
MSKKKGVFVIIDGPDGSGKTTIVHGITDYLKNKGKKVFDLKEYWKTSHTLPEPEELYIYDVIISAEPTYSLVGGAIRDELVKENKRHYSAFATATAFSLDRLILYKRIIIPLLEQGKTIIQDRSVTTSIVYQPIQAEPLSLKKLLSLEGNELALKYRPDLLIIADTQPEVCLKRLSERAQKDHAVFENLDFQTKAYKRFMSKWFSKLFKDRGSRVVYLDAGKSIRETINEAIRIYEDFAKK